MYLANLKLLQWIRDETGLNYVRGYAARSVDSRRRLVGVPFGRPVGGGNVGYSSQCAKFG